MHAVVTVCALVDTALSRDGIVTPNLRVTGPVMLSEESPSLSGITSVVKRVKRAMVGRKPVATVQAWGKALTTATVKEIPSDFGVVKRLRIFCIDMVRRTTGCNTEVHFTIGMSKIAGERVDGSVRKLA